MEIIIEISKEQAERLRISSDKLTFEELRRKIAMAELSETLEKSHQIAEEYGIDKWTMEDINNLIKEAKADQNGKNSD